MRITVGITSYNNGDNIAAILSDVAHQQLEEGDSICETLVVASGCTDNTLIEAERFANSDPRFNVIREHTRLGKPSAINKIITHMKGDVLLLLCGDVRLPQADFVSRIVHELDTEVGVVSSRPVPFSERRTLLGNASWLMWALHDKTLSFQSCNHLLGHAGEAFAMKKEALEEVPFGVINDDAYMVIRAQQKGFKVSYARELIVYNKPPRRADELVIQRARIIRGHAELKKLVGTRPDVLDTLAVRRPLVALRIVREAVRDEAGKKMFRPGSFLLLVTLEVAAHCLAILRRADNQWAQASTAKWL